MRKNGNHWNQNSSYSQGREKEKGKAMEESSKERREGERNGEDRGGARGKKSPETKAGMMRVASVTTMTTAMATCLDDCNDDSGPEWWATGYGRGTRATASTYIRRPSNRLPRTFHAASSARVASHGPDPGQLYTASTIPHHPSIDSHTRKLLPSHFPTSSPSMHPALGPTPPARCFRNYIKCNFAAPVASPSSTSITLAWDSFARSLGARISSRREDFALGCLGLS